MKKVRFLSMLLAVSLAASTLSGITAYADSQRVVTLGADLSEEQKDTVLKFFGVTEEDLKTVDLVTVTNKDEHEVLDGVAPDSAIGSKTFSCAYIEPTMSGGIKIKTANLTYVTVNTLHNALQTAGVQNCNLIVTAPFEVSGTGALTGVFKAFESVGTELDEGKQEAAAEELMVGAKLEAEYGEASAELVMEVKKDIIGGDDLSEDDIKDIILEESEKRDIKLSEEDLESIYSLMDKIKSLDYDVDAFSQKLEDLSAGLEEKIKENEGLLDKIGNFFKFIGDFFVGLFTGGTSNEEVEESTQEESSIFDNVDTDVYEFDSNSVEDVDGLEEGE